MRRIRTRSRVTWLAAALSPLLLAGCPPEPTTAVPTVENIDERPARFASERVALVGEVDDVVGPRTFVLENDDLLWDDEVTVLARRPIRYGDQRLGAGEDVAVTGRVHFVGTVELERELGWDLDPELEVELDGEPVVVAERVSRIEETARWSEVDSPQGVVVNLVAVDASPSPWALAGEPLRLDGVPILRRVGQGLWVGFGGSSKIYVESRSVADELEPGDRVDVAGTLRPTPPLDIVKESWELYGPMLETVAGRPLYVDADRVEPSEREGGRFAAASTREYLAAPERQLGQWVSIQDVVVDEVISDRAFWMQPLQARGDDGRFLGVVREDVPAREMIDIDAGQRLEFWGLALDASDVDRVAGTLEQDARDAISRVPGFVTMYWDDVVIRRAAP